MVIKLFLDTPKPGDEELAKVLKKYGNVYTQGIPNKTLEPHFKGIGFVNAYVNLKGEVEGFAIKHSLPLKLASDWNNQEISVIEKQLKLPPVPATLPWPSISFSDLLQEKIPNDLLQHKIVFIFLKDENTKKFKISGGGELNQAEVVALITDYLIALKSK